MKFIFITNQPSVAQVMALADVDRIMVDLEINGKVARQGHLDTVISQHTYQDVTAIRYALNEIGKGELMVRINPLCSGSKCEIDEIISRGADRIMLPMFTHPDDVSSCLDLIRGRVPLTLLLETGAAFARLPQILQVQGFDDIHIGLNDMHIDLGLDFMFELFSSGLLDYAAALFRELRIPFGIGGVSCIGHGNLPSELILAAHMQLGSDRVILSRSFSRFIDISSSAKDEICKIKEFVSREDLDLLSMRLQMDKCVMAIVKEIRSSVYS